MALKPDRHEMATDITRTLDVAVERGCVAFHKTSGSGVAIGDSANAASIYNDPSGKFVCGILMNDVVDIDETVRHRNSHKDEMKVGERVRLLTHGWCVTNRITGTPTVGATAYASTSGILTPTVSATGGTAATPKVGRFESIKDENGYVKVSISLPIV